MNVKVSARDVTHAGLWLALYVLLALYPLLWLAAVPAHGGGTFRGGLAAALGFLALSTMAMQFVLTARFQWFEPPFGTDLERPPPVWPGEQGYVTESILARHLHPDRRHTYIVCGPPVMMDAVERVLAHLGVPLADVHSERFDLV